MDCPASGHVFKNAFEGFKTGLRSHGIFNGFVSCCNMTLLAMSEIPLAAFTAKGGTSPLFSSVCILRIEPCQTGLRIWSFQELNNVNAGNVKRNRNSLQLKMVVSAQETPANQIGVKLPTAQCSRKKRITPVVTLRIPPKGHTKPLSIHCQKPGKNDANGENNSQAKSSENHDDNCQLKMLTLSGLKRNWTPQKDPATISCTGSSCHELPSEPTKLSQYFGTTYNKMTWQTKNRSWHRTCYTSRLCVS